MGNKKKKRKRNKLQPYQLNNVLMKRASDSFDGFALNKDEMMEMNENGNNYKTERTYKQQQYAKDDMNVLSSNDMMTDSSNDEERNQLQLEPTKLTKRVISADNVLSQSQINKRRNKQIIVLNSTKRTKDKVISPPPITSKSGFQSLLRPTMSADAIALKKLNQKY